MIWKTRETCSHCGAQYEIDVRDLGHKDSGSISCQCCGEILREWKNEARSYSIARLTSSGNIAPKYNDIEKYKGRRLKFTKGDTEFEGVVKGLSELVMAASAEKLIKPWVIETDKEDVHLNPEDGWLICAG